ncbi:hypothetical protein EC844_13019 [Acinetobacter calcoaceticus]|uniref:Uncharacterized protein n=1 Tax=Acinetobacter calcoaceticus TaxID=471 RepID=A0A4R1XDA0_ACICA|nr:hypothetical protein EC844_13019 [Acinetobacter calcoaceticus]
MNKFAILILTSMLSAGVWADINCEKLAKIADDNGLMHGSKYIYTVQGNKGLRTYFHSAPSEQCKIKNLFLIPNDSVIAYQQFKNENRTWIYVMYIDKNGNDTMGWMKVQHFKITSKFSNNDPDD